MLMNSRPRFISSQLANILADLDDHISSTTTGMQSKKASKLLPYPGLRSCHFYWFEDEDVVRFCSLPRHGLGLAGMRFFENLDKTDVVLSSTEAEDLEVAARTIVEWTSWMD